MKKLLVVVIIAVIVALLLAYKCSRSRGAENAETSPETSQAAPAEEAAPAQEAEPAPAAEEAAPAENKEAAEEEVKEEPAPEQKEEPAPAPAPAKKEKKEAKPDNADGEKVEKPAPKAVEEKKPFEREEKAVPERPTPALSSREPEGSNIDSAGVSKVINVSKAAIKRCYDKALTSNPMLKGKLSVKININEQGRVSNTEVVDDSLHDAEVAKCVKGVIGRLRFPKPAGGTASITFPFAFDPKNQ